MILEINSLSKKYNDKVVIHNLCLAFEKGGILRILGENGAGKTTLMNIISGIIKPDSGEIFVDGKKKHSQSSKNCTCSAREQ